MDKKFATIIADGIKAGKSFDDINVELKAAGANFHLDMDGKTSGWTEQEMAEGFIPADKEPEDVKHLHDLMVYAPDKANTEEEVWVAEGKYRIYWDEDGHPEKAIRLNK